MDTVDAIVLREQLARNRKVSDRARTTDEAARALLWFDEHAMSPHGPARRNLLVDALKDPPRVTACLTPDADLAQRYVRRAFEALRIEILERAISIAQADLRRAESKAEKSP